jgi:hypothetical protein
MGDSLIVKRAYRRMTSFTQWRNEEDCDGYRDVIEAHQRVSDAVGGSIIPSNGSGKTCT